VCGPGDVALPARAGMYRWGMECSRFRDTGDWGRALLGRSHWTSAYASGIKPFVDVYAGTIEGISTSRIRRGRLWWQCHQITTCHRRRVIDTANHRLSQLRNPGTEAGTVDSPPPGLIRSAWDRRFQTAHKTGDHAAAGNIVVGARPENRIGGGHLLDLGPCRSSRLSACGAVCRRVHDRRARQSKLTQDAGFDDFLGQRRRKRGDRTWASPP